MWSDPKNYPYKSGRLFLGHVDGQEIGIETERHAITIAGAGSGKGTSVIIPNLLKWPHNALVIDPKGEAAEATAVKRAAMGQAVHVLDPFGSARVPERFLASYNPLDDLDPDALTIKEDIDVLADGIVMRPDPHAAHWDDGAQAVIAGLIAYVKMRAPEERRNLIEVRAILGDDDALAEALEKMKGMTECAGAAKEAYATVYAKEGQYFVSNARKNTRWLDSKAMVDTLSRSTFSLSDLKGGKASVFLVLPANYLGQHGRFLRLFVRSGIEAMARKTEAGNLRGEQCLFLLDEFFSLGYIDEISKAAGLMRGYGLQLWPILQDLGQLVTLYGREGAETFFGNADIHQFFGNTDPMTLEQISARLGVFDMSEIPLPPSTPAAPMGSFGQGISNMSQGAKSGSARVAGSILGSVFADMEAQAYAYRQAKHQDDLLFYQREMAKHGRPRVQPDQVAQIVQKKDDAVANSMICFVYGREALKVKLAPFFRPLKPPPTVAELKAYSPQEIIGGFAVIIAIGCFGGFVLSAIIPSLLPIQGVFLGGFIAAVFGFFDWQKNRAQAKDEARLREAKALVESIWAQQALEAQPTDKIVIPDKLKMAMRKNEGTANQTPKALPPPAADPLAGLDVGWEKVMKDLER